MDRTQIPQSLPLAQSIRADLTLCEWTSFCVTRIDDPTPMTGLECAMDENDYLLGLFGYHAVPDPSHGMVLSTDPFIAIDLYGRDLSAQRLMARIERLAVSLSCGAIHIAMGGAGSRLPQEGGAQFEKFQNLGFQPDALRFCKHLN